MLDKDDNHNNNNNNTTTMITIVTLLVVVFAGMCGYMQMLLQAYSSCRSSTSLLPERMWKPSYTAGLS